MKKQEYKSEMNNIKASEEFKQNTYNLMVKELEEKKKTKNKINIQKGRRTMERRRVIIAGLATVTACGILVFGMNINNQNPGEIKEPVNQGEVSKEPIQQGITGKVKVNIEGTITEVSEDGKSFKLDDNLWVDITEETELGISGPTAAPKEEQFFDEEFKVGNSIAGFTLEDVESERVKAYVIYSNWNWELDKK